MKTAATFKKRLFLVGFTLLGLGASLLQAQPSPTVLVQADPVVGLYLTDAGGGTLYLNRKDVKGGKSKCNKACLERWQPLLLEGELVAPPELMGTLTVVARDDGGRQVAYEGWPLYTSKEDRQKGDAKANGKDKQWFVANVGLTVRVSKNPVYGDILIGPDGMTLYTFANDAGTDVGCADSCAENWQPLVVTEKPTASTQIAQNVSFFKRRSREKRGERFQITYKGKPLYYFSRDERPGDVKGQGLADLWSVAKP